MIRSFWIHINSKNVDPSAINQSTVDNNFFVFLVVNELMNEFKKH